MTDKKPCVTCKWLKMEKVLVNPDGQVIPCCYMANTLLLNLTVTGQGRVWDNNEVLKKYKDNKEQYNLDNKNMEDILTSDWFNEDLPESWKDYKTLPEMCMIFCDENYVKDI